MLSKKKILLVSLSVLIAANIAISNTFAQTTKNVANTDVIKTVNPADLVQSPNSFLNNKVKMTATFDKFSLLGLDYKPTNRDSKKYISFLIKRSDITDNHTIPLSELKLIIPREKAEKLINMESGDKIEITGNVFSNALSDPWVDVENVTILTPKNKNVAAAKKTERAEIK
jgi:hypothetical protein